MARIKGNQTPPKRLTPKGTAPLPSKTRVVKPGRGRPAKGWPQPSGSVTPDSPTVA
jgi:hypothetical protein